MDLKFNFSIIMNICKQEHVNSVTRKKLDYLSIWLSASDNYVQQLV